MSVTATPAFAEVMRQIAGGLRPDRVRDADLLADFVTDQNTGFADLVARHGPLVWGVCRRGLTDPNDAEDAFQATFLALARQARSLADRVSGHETLAGWLHLTARRITHNVRRARTRRCEHERRAAAERETQADLVVEPGALGSVLDEELARLPARFRETIVLCYFQGKTHADAARQLGCPVGSVSSRLARGCELLRDALARRGVTLSIGLMTVAVAVAGAGGHAGAALPPGLVQSTITAARAFAVGGPATTEPGRLALGVVQAKSGLRGKISGLVVVAALGMTLAAAMVSQKPVHADGPTAANPTTAPETQPRTDSSGDPLPEGAVARLGTLRFRTGQMGTAASVAFGPDGKQLISAHGTDVLFVWEPASGRELRRLDAPQICSGVSATPNGRRMIAVGHAEVWAWDLAANQPLVLWKTKIGRLIRANAEISPDGRWVAVGGETKGNVVLLDAATGDEVRTLSVGGSGFAFSSDSKLLAVWAKAPSLNAGTKTDVTVWNVADGKLRYTLPFANTTVTSVAFAPDGKTVATVAEDRRLQLWEADSGKAQSKLAEDADPHASVGFVKDGTLVEASAGRIRFWNPITGKQSKPAIKTTDTSDVYRLSADGTQLAGAGLFGVSLHEVASGREIGTTAGMPDGLVHSVTFTPDSSAMVMAVYSESAGAALHLWDAKDGRLRRRTEVGPRQIVWGVDVASDGTVSAACVPLYQTPQPPTRIVTWDADLARVRATFSLPTGVRCGAASPDNRLIAISTGERVILCDRTTGKEVRTLPGKCEATSLVFSADGSCLGALDPAAKRVTVWSLADKRDKPWVWSPAPVMGKVADIRAPLALAPDGRMFALNATGMHGIVSVIETATGTELWHADARLSGLPAQEFAFAPDGRTLAAAGTDGTVRVWEVASGGERYRFAGHRAGVFSVAYSPDSRRLASASYDSTALVWDVATLPRGTSTGKAAVGDPWLVLAGQDTAAAARAIATLTDAPDTAIPLLRTKLTPPPAAKPEQIRQWLTDLGADDFKARETASRELSLRGDLVLPELRRALTNADVAEVRSRLEQLINRLGAQSPDRRAVIRGIEALERMGTNPDSQRLLRELAEAPAESVLGREARAAYRRLTAPPPQ
ncbi:ECF RNA polymerase sigma factor SigE [Gemmata sp. SH-PL17]|uniref:sigma-70 family RNA polymerase sigma factor n=1 Tax=Gemmata sp. SH-PL17 TaxID=1630693 RepID=UPI00078D4436|nr:sigma-70 family RNA polymerase sigma factor [Gemmata sp. SH-PL17]AMV27760.1 ECF RNA polymerase sigma factor SigE [Gemmata sp. SH-PL17]